MSSFVGFLLPEFNGGSFNLSLENRRKSFSQDLSRWSLERRSRERFGFSATDDVTADVDVTVVAGDDDGGLERPVEVLAHRGFEIVADVAPESLAHVHVLADHRDVHGALVT